MLCTANYRALVARKPTANSRRCSPQTFEGKIYLSYVHVSTTPPLPRTTAPLFQSCDANSLARACIIALDTRSAHEVASSLLASWQKNRNGAADGDVRTRKAAVQSLSRDLQVVVQQLGGAPILVRSAPSAGPHDSPGTLLEEVMGILMETMAKVMFKCLADPTEACR